MGNKKKVTIIAKCSLTGSLVKFGNPEQAKAIGKHKSVRLFNKKAIGGKFKNLKKHVTYDLVPWVAGNCAEMEKMKEKSITITEYLKLPEIVEIS